MTAPVLIFYDGWQVWSSDLGIVRTGDEISTSVEFYRHSTPVPVTDGTAPRLDHLGGHRYAAVARVLDTGAMVVLDLGVLRALRWVKPGDRDPGFVTGTTVALELGLGINAWLGSPETERAAELHGTHHRWLVHRILHVVRDEEPTEIAEASVGTVDAGGERQYCLLECTPLA